MHSLIEDIGNLTVMELVNLTKDIEDKFGVKASDRTTVQNADEDKPQEAKVEQTEFNVFMTVVGPDKVACIKLVREITSLGLRDSKALIEAIPCVIKEGLSKKDAEDLGHRLDSVQIKYEFK